MRDTWRSFTCLEFDPSIHELLDTLESVYPISTCESGTLLAEVKTNKRWAHIAIEDWLACAVAEGLITYAEYVELLRKIS